MQRKSSQNVKSVACVMSKSGTKATISGKNSLKSCSCVVFYQIETGYFNENATLWRKSRKKRCHTGFSGGCSEKVCPAPQKCITRTSLYTVLDIKFFRIPVNQQGNGYDKWVQTRGYRACVFNMPIPLRVCLTGVPT